MNYNPHHHHFMAAAKIAADLPENDDAAREVLRITGEMLSLRRSLIDQARQQPADGGELQANAA